MTIFLQILFLLLAYLFGSIPFGFIISKLKGIDIRQIGSHNIGSTNVGRALGKRYAVLTFFFDMLKGALFVILFRYGIINSKYMIIDPSIYGFIAMIGHSFPIYLKFKGGKAVATGAGFTFAYLPLAIPIGIITFFTVIKITKISALGSLTATLFITISAIICTIIGIDPITNVTINWYFALFATFALILIYVKHIPNIKRLINKSELTAGRIKK